MRQKTGVASFRLTLTLTWPARTSLGKVIIGSGRFMGMVRYSQPERRGVSLRHARDARKLSRLTNRGGAPPEAGVRT